MNDTEIRVKAMAMAADRARPYEPAVETIVRAQMFYDFMTGRPRGPAVDPDSAILGIDLSTGRPADEPDAATASVQGGIAGAVS